MLPPSALSQLVVNRAKRTGEWLGCGGSFGYGGCAGLFMSNARMDGWGGLRVKGGETSHSHP